MSRTVDGALESLPHFPLLQGHDVLADLPHEGPILGAADFAQVLALTARISGSMA